MTGPGSPRGRGQTTQDFAVGIGIFLLAVAFVFAFVPQALPADGAADGGEASLADRAAATFVDDTAVRETGTTLDGSAVSGEYLSRTWTGDRLNERLGLPSTVQVNVSVRYLNGSRVSGINGWEAAVGDSYDDQATVSSATRVVRFDESTGTCSAEPCRLVVTVW